MEIEKGRERVSGQKEYNLQALKTEMNWDIAKV